MQGHIPYLNTEYARNKDVECYDIEAKQKENAAVVYKEDTPAGVSEDCQVAAANKKLEEVWKK